MFICAIGATQTVDVAPFSAVQNHGSIDIEVKIDPSAQEPYKLILDGEKESIDRVQYSSRGGTLKITSKRAYGSYDNVRLRTVVRSLENIRVHGSGDILVTGFKGDGLKLTSMGSGDVTLKGDVGDFEARLKGSGDLKVQNLGADRVNVVCSGSGDVLLEGRVSNLEVKLTGSGDVEAAKLKADKVKVSLMGSGDLTVCSSSAVQQRVYGSGDVRIKCK